MSRDDVDPFDDVQAELEGFGALAGEGIESHYASRDRADDRGFTRSVKCDNCGTPTNVTMEWTELVVLANGQAPTGWQYSKKHGGFIYPAEGCRQCTFLLPIVMLPDTAQRILGNSIKSGVVKADVIQGIDQRVKQQLTQMQQRR